MSDTTSDKKPHQLRKEIKRLTESRNKIKEKGQIRSRAIKDYQDRLREVTESRERWKRQYKEGEKERTHLQNEADRLHEAFTQIRLERDQILKELSDLKKTTQKPH